MTTKEFDLLLAEIRGVRTCVGGLNVEMTSLGAELRAHDQRDDDRFESIRTKLTGHMAEDERYVENLENTKVTAAAKRDGWLRAAVMVLLGAGIATVSKWLMGG